MLDPRCAYRYLLRVASFPADQYIVHTLPKPIATGMAPSRQDYVKGTIEVDPEVIHSDQLNFN